MLPKQEVVAMLLAGGRGSRLGVLTWPSPQFRSEASIASSISRCPTA